jgi:bile acid transporter
LLHYNLLSSICINCLDSKQRDHINIMSDAFSLLALVVIIVLGLGLGATTTTDDFRIALSTPKPVFIGFASQYMFMPLVAYALAHIFNMKEEYAVGIILTGSSPGGTTSNIFTYWSKGNVALSITMSFFSNVAAFGMLPFLVFILIKTAYNADIQIPWSSIFVSLCLIIFPCLLGLSVRHNNTEFKMGGKFIWKWMEKLTTVFGIIFFIGALALGVVAYFDEIMGAPASLWISAILMEPCGAFFGYGVAYAVGIGRKDCRTIAIETGVQSFTLTMAIIALSFEGEERDDVLLFPLLYGTMYIVNSIWIVALLRYVVAPLDDDCDDQKSLTSEIDGDVDNQKEVEFSDMEGNDV